MLSGHTIKAHTAYKKCTYNMKTEKALTLKQQAVVDALPEYGWNIVQAAISVGYSKSYANTQLPAKIKKDSRFCKAIERKRGSIETKQQTRRERRLRNLDEIIEDCDTTCRDRIQAIQVQGKMCGWLSETINHENTSRQAQIDSSLKSAAQRIALLLQDTSGRKQITSANTTIIDADAHAADGRGRDSHDIAASSEDVTLSNDHMADHTADHTADAADSGTIVSTNPDSGSADAASPNTSSTSNNHNDNRVRGGDVTSSIDHKDDQTTIRSNDNNVTTSDVTTPGADRTPVAPPKEAS